MGKDKYKVRNWGGYNEGLKQRGAINIWIDDCVLDQWRYQGERKRGGQAAYSDRSIEICLVVRKVYHLGLRQTEGFMKSFFAQVKVALPVPCYTQICRRSRHLHVDISCGKSKAVTDIVVDSTGLKVYGEGEWKVRRHGWSKHRTWMKLHVALDADDQQLKAVALSTNAVDDAQAAETLVSEIDTLIGSFTADGAYDKEKLRKALYQKAKQQDEDILQCIPPRCNAVCDKAGRRHLQQRDDDIKAIRRLGRGQWKVLSNYHQRSKAETFMSRYKVIVGSGLQAREESRQKTEVRIGCKILNQMLHLAKPQSEKVA